MEHHQSNYEITSKDGIQKRESPVKNGTSTVKIRNQQLKFENLKITSDIQKNIANKHVSNHP